MVALEMARIMNQVDLLLVPSLRDEMLTITNFTGHPSLTLRAGFVEVSEARSDWAPDPANPLPKFNPPRRVPHGVTLIGRLFDEGTIARAGLALERHFNVAQRKPTRLLEQLASLINPRKKPLAHPQGAFLQLLTQIQCKIFGESGEIPLQSDP